MQQISRDPFARTTLLREVVPTPKSCDFCGSKRKSGKLFRYSVESDGGSRNSIRGLFCSKSCMEAYQ